MNKYLVEFIGSMFLIYVGFATNDPLAVGATLTIIKMLYAGQFNPAITIALTFAHKLPYSETIPYILSQVAGGLVAFELYNRF